MPKDIYEVSEVADDLDVCLLWRSGQLLGECRISTLKELAKKHSVKIRGLP